MGKLIGKLLFLVTESSINTLYFSLQSTVSVATTFQYKYVI